MPSPFRESADVIEHGDALRQRLHEDGYLFLPGLLPRDVLEELRLTWLRIICDAGWVRRDRDLNEGVADLNGFCVEPEPRYMDVYHDVYRLPEFHGLQHHPRLIGLFERILGGEVLPHPRLIGRTIFPAREAYTTPPHQDYIPIQGTPESYTAWIPLSDIPPEMGGLQLSEGSHQRGVYEFRPALGAGGIEVVDPLEGSWVNSPFRQGDVLIFHSMTVHKGVPCHGERLRLSMDARYQRVADPIVEEGLKPHGNLITWEDVYAGWPEGTRKYYWRELDLYLADYDRSYLEKRDEMAFEMAERGDQIAVSALQRIVSRDPDPEKRRRAEQSLRDLGASDA